MIINEFNIIVVKFNLLVNFTNNQFLYFFNCLGGENQVPFYKTLVGTRIYYSEQDLLTNSHLGFFSHYFTRIDRVINNYYRLKITTSPIFLRNFIFSHIENLMAFLGT